MKATDNIYARWEEPQLGCLLAIRQIILNVNDGILETVKYGMSCFLYKDRPFCYLWIDKHNNFPYILMVDGLKMKHPLLVQGDRKRMSVLDIDPNADIPLDTIIEVLEEGLALRG